MRCNSLYEAALEVARDWRRHWTHDEPGYFERGMGVDANMTHDLARRIAENMGSCRHPGCACVCGHRKECPDDGPSLTKGVGSEG